MSDETLDIISARSRRNDSEIVDLRNRVTKIETKLSADYEWRKKVDENLLMINSKLETLLVADGKTYHTAKIAVITTFVSSIVGYIVGVMLR